MKIRKGKREEIEAFISLLQLVHAGMEHKEWFYLDPPEDVRRMGTEGMLEFWAAVEQDRLAGAFSVIFPGLTELNYGYDLGLSAEELRRVVNMDTIAVHPDYRGRGLQKTLMQTAEQALSQSGDKILLCTVHPDNRYSLRNVQEQGYVIQKRLEKYGSVRYILRKDLPGAGE